MTACGPRCRWRRCPIAPSTARSRASSVALRSSVRTLDTEVDVANPEGALRSGLYVNVTFEVPRLIPPADPLRGADLRCGRNYQVAVVQPDDTVKLQPITIARDLGTVLELRSGLKGGDTVVLNPPADLRDGSRIVRKIVLRQGSCGRACRAGQRGMTEMADDSPYAISFAADMTHASRPDGAPFDNAARSITPAVQPKRQARSRISVSIIKRIKGWPTFLWLRMTACSGRNWIGTDGVRISGR